ncbi:hypothetical protein J2T60_000116 [Natronospira proteinivora]|uniref:Uncharacterized protein n=1 Tax=Natronospira proteinivora TaxID=1807133 RepID=A0ABT1G4E1_9GAMM|nr:hypothetical protein [Natronospira proteinivora]
MGAAVPDIRLTGHITDLLFAENGELFTCL